ncbi:zf-CCHC_4 domain-containing protein [Raphanus sativus]|nr:zf-CCHC_4 domain-containing protein [Raphanus sativus]
MERPLAAGPLTRGLEMEERHPAPRKQLQQPPAPVFQERLDRHGNPFGDRVSTKQTRNPPPEKHEGEREASRLIETRRFTDQRTLEYASPQYSRYRESNGRNFRQGRDLFPQRSEGQ